MDSAREYILAQLADTGELVFSGYAGRPPSPYDAHWYAWDEAHDDAEVAYEAWCDRQDRASYAVYRAAQDRADAAQDALARYFTRAADAHAA